MDVVRWPCWPGPPRAPWRWTTAKPRKGTTRSRGRLGNGCPCDGEYEGLLVRLPSPENNKRCGWVEEWPSQQWSRWGGAACAVAQPATRGGSRQCHRSWFGRLEQEDQILKKQHDRWINIQRSTATRIVCGLSWQSQSTRQPSRPTS